MLRTAKSFFAILILLNPLVFNQAYAYNNVNKNNTIALASHIFEDIVTKSGTNMILVKNSEKYDESKDPALRRGTENWEQPQGSFWVIPAAVFGLIFVVLFFNKEK